MKHLKFPINLAFSTPQFWLVALTAGLIAIHLTLTWRLDNSSHLASSFLFCFTAAYLAWEKRSQLNLNTSIIASLLGAMIVGIVLIKSTAISGSHFLRLSPFAAAVGLAFLKEHLIFLISLYSQ